MKLYEDKPTICIAGPARLSYANLFKPRKNDLSQKTEFSTVLLIPKNPHQYQSDGKAEGAGITKCIKAAAADKWGEKAGSYRNPLKDGDIEKNGDGESKHPGHWFITVKTGEEYPPMIINPAREPFGLESPEQKRNSWQSGDWAKVKISFKAYESGPNKGVSGYLQAVQFLHKDEPFGGGASTNDFDNEAGEGVDIAEDVDPFQ